MMQQTNFLFYLLMGEFSLFILGILFVLIYEISAKQKEPFKLPTLSLHRSSLPQDTWLQKIITDVKAIYKITAPEFYQSDDGHTLYVSVKGASNWTPEQIVLWLLAHKPEFLKQLQEKDPAAFDAFNSLVSQVTTATIEVALDKLHVLPTYKRQLVVWKVPLLNLPNTIIPNQIVVKEL